MTDAQNLPAEVTDPDPQPQAVAVRSTEMTELELFAIAASQAHRLAQSLAKTNFVPSSMKGKPDDVAAAILAGQELGLQPMATLRSIDIIQGVPTLRAHTIRALLQSNGHSINVVESTNERCEMRGRRKGEQDWTTVVWDIPRAKLLELTGKDQWKKQPKTMLIARATAELGRLIAADLLLAMPYAAEEIEEPYQAGPVFVGAPLTAEDILADGVVDSEVTATPEQVASVQRVQQGWLDRFIGAERPAESVPAAAEPPPAPETPTPAPKPAQRRHQGLRDVAQAAVEPDPDADAWGDIEVRRPGQDA